MLAGGRTGNMACGQRWTLCGVGLCWGVWWRKAPAASYGSAMVNVNSKVQARNRVREAQIRTKEARIERERHNVDDAASFLVEQGRMAAIDEWEHNRV